MTQTELITLDAALEQFRGLMEQLDESRRDAQSFAATLRQELEQCRAENLRLQSDLDAMIERAAVP